MSYWLKKAKDIYSRRGAESAGVSIICRSDFSRELSIFATEVAPNTCEYLCVLCASARVKSSSFFKKHKTPLRSLRLGEKNLMPDIYNANVCFQPGAGR